jgi:hypothetical protein
MVPFDDLDFQMFSGAERGADGTVPHLNSNDFDVLVDVSAFGHTAEFHPATVVADNTGIQFMLTNDAVWQLHLSNIHLALLVAQALPYTISTDRLRQLGFEQIV